MILVAILLLSGVCIFIEILPPFPGNSKSHHIIHTKLTHGKTQTFRDPNVPINWEKVSNSFYSVEYDPLHPSKLFLNAKAVTTCGIGNMAIFFYSSHGSNGKRQLLFPCSVLLNMCEHQELPARSATVAFFIPTDLFWFVAASPPPWV